MKNMQIPNEWDMRYTQRAKRQIAQRAMRGQIYRALVEFITNADDKYRDLEEEGQLSIGKIRIEIERKRKGSLSSVRVKDQATGMSREEMYLKLGGVGERTSGFELGKARRGLHGRGAKDAAVLGTVRFESIKDNLYNCMEIPPTFIPRFVNKDKPLKASDELREQLGLRKGNGTVVTLVVGDEVQIPQHEKLLEKFSRYYSMRDIFSNVNRKVILVDLRDGKEDKLSYSYPTGGETVFNDNIDLPDYPLAKAHLLIEKYPVPFESAELPVREGILLKSEAGIHDCHYFNLDSDPLAWRFRGVLTCYYIDHLVREYEDIEANSNDLINCFPKTNPDRILDPLRDGLIREHPFTISLYAKAKSVLKDFVSQLKKEESTHRHDVSDENLDKDLEQASKELSKIFDRKLIELDAEATDININDPTIQSLGHGLHIIPPKDQPIVINEPKTFSVVVKHFEPLDEALPLTLSCSNPEHIKLRQNLLHLRRFSENNQVARTSFTVEGLKVGSEGFIEARYNGYDNTLRLEVISTRPAAEIPEGLSFEHPRYKLKLNKQKEIVLRLKSQLPRNQECIAKIISNNNEIILKNGGLCELRSASDRTLLIGKCLVQGRQINAEGTVIAEIEELKPAETQITVVERELSSGSKFKFRPVEDDFLSLRYMWDDKDRSLLLIGAMHSSIRRYLGQPDAEGNYPGKNSPVYRTVLAEVIAEALAFKILEKVFVREGQQRMLDYPATDRYFHNHFSDFLKISHKYLCKEPEQILFETLVREVVQETGN